MSRPDCPPTPPAAVLCLGCATMDHIFSVAEIPARPLKYRARAFQSVAFANAAAIKVTRFGGLSGAPTCAEADDLLARSPPL